MRVIGATDPAAASGSAPARMIRAAWRNSISTACTSDKTIAIVPKISTPAGAALPPRFRASISRWVKWPPVETCRTHADQASPALSSSAMAVTPRVLAAATVSRPPVMSSSGLARRVSAIRAPAAITPPIATAAVIGSSHCWMRATAGSAARSGDGMRSHQVAVFSTIHRTPALIACAMLLSTSPAALAVTEWTALPTTRQAGSVKVLQCMAHPSFGNAV